MTTDKSATSVVAASATPTSTRASDTSYVSSRWVFLPPHIREAIVTLVDAALLMHESRSQRKSAPPEASE